MAAAVVRTVLPVPPPEPEAAPRPPTVALPPPPSRVARTDIATAPLARVETVAVMAASGAGSWIDRGNVDRVQG